PQTGRGPATTRSRRQPGLPHQRRPGRAPRQPQGRPRTGAADARRRRLSSRGHRVRHPVRPDPHDRAGFRPGLAPGSRPRGRRRRHARGGEPGEIHRYSAAVRLGSTTGGRRPRRGAGSAPGALMTAQERMLEALRTEVLTGALQPGEQVVQELIAEQHGVSRVPVREALQTLTSEGLITHLPHRGYFVTELSVPDLLEVYRLRELLETQALRTGIPVLTDTDVA